MIKRAIVSLFFLSVFASCPAWAKDGFDGIRCGDDIARVLQGKVLPNDAAADIESRHKAIGLKDVGGDEISDTLNTVDWMICGKEYVVLQDGDTVRDVMPMPAHTRRYPEFAEGTCQRNGKPEMAAAILDNPDGEHATKPYSSDDATLLAARSAWKVDEKKKTFVGVPAAGLRCPRGGIVTGDGGP